MNERIPRYRADERLSDDVVCMSYDVAQLEVDNEALRQVQHDSQRLLNAVVCSPVYHKVKDTYTDLKRAIEILTGEDKERSG